MKGTFYIIIQTDDYYFLACFLYVDGSTHVSIGINGNELLHALGV